MMVRPLPFYLALMLTLISVAANGADFEYGGRPADSVFDPVGLLEPQEVKEISEPLARIRRDEGIDIVVAILPGLDGAAPEHVARRFAAEWCEAPIHAVVLHVPGQKDGPWIVPAGKLIGFLKPEVLAQSIADGKRRAAGEPDEQAKVRSAANEAADMLRYWMATAINRSEFLRTKRTEIRLEQEAKAYNWRIVMVSGAALFIAAVLGISLLVYLFRRTGERCFSNSVPPRRLGAPHAGGNRAIVEFGNTPV